MNPAARVNASVLTSARVQPHSLEAEEYLLSCCILDGADAVARCISSGIESKSFYAPANQVIFGQLVDMHKRGLPIEAGTLAEELVGAKKLDQIGGFAYLTQISGRIPTVAQVDFFIEKVRGMYQLREIIKAASTAIEYCFTSTTENFPAISSELRTSIENIERGTPVSGLRGIATFTPPADDDRDTLLGNRYLVRGDGAILSCSAGMGKSSMAIQKAITYALGRPFFGIQPHGKLRSLIVQAEDSDGDVGEVVESVIQSMELTEAEIAEVNERVVVKTERALRGERFLAALRGWIRQHKPDLVFINPLLAFVDGDVNEAKDVGKFLREGLNAINAPPAFAYIIVHHTTKPPTGKNKGERSWNEVMYDMAGSAELTNWARAVLSLRPTPTKGHFDLVLAKRGTRAGVVKEVEHNMSTRLEPTTTIPLKHAEGTINVPGRKRPMPRIFWEYRTENTDEAQPTVSKGGRPRKYTFADFVNVFPTDPAKGLGYRALLRAATDIKPISKGAFEDLVEEALSLNLIGCDSSDPKHPRYYRILSK